VAQDQLAGACALGHAADLGDVGVQSGHPVQGGTRDAMPLEVAEVGDLVNEDVGALSQGDQVVIHGGVAGEHHGAVRGVETVRQRRNRVAVGDRDGGDPDNFVAEDEYRSLGGALGAGGALGLDREGDVDAPDERARVRHAGVQRHDVQMVGVAREDALD